ncbi:hypothetical protein QOT17_020547 [Balamuthia mandrillaris]
MAKESAGKAKESAGKATLAAQQQACYVLPPTAPADLSFVIDSKAVLNFYKKKEVYLEQNGTLALVFSLKAKNLVGLPTLELLDLQNRQLMAAACNSGMVASSWTWTVLQAAQPIATITVRRFQLLFFFNPLLLLLFLIPVSSSLTGNASRARNVPLASRLSTVLSAAEQKHPTTGRGGSC